MKVLIGGIVTESITGYTRYGIAIRSFKAYGPGSGKPYSVSDSGVVDVIWDARIVCFGVGSVCYVCKFSPLAALLYLSERQSRFYEQLLTTPPEEQGNLMQIYNRTDGLPNPCVEIASKI